MANIITFDISEDELGATIDRAFKKLEGYLEEIYIYHRPDSTLTLQVRYSGKERDLTDIGGLPFKYVKCFVISR